MNLLNFYRLLNIYENYLNKLDNLILCKNIINSLSDKDKIIMKNIVFFHIIKNNINKNPDKKLDIILPFYLKYKLKKIDKIYLIKILDLNYNLQNLLNKKINYKNKYNLLSLEAKKLYNKKRTLQRKINLDLLNLNYYVVINIINGIITYLVKKKTKI